MWIWLRTTCVPFYDTFILAEAMVEFEKMFGRKPRFHQGEGMTHEVLAKAKDIINSTVIHFGEGRRNAATWACIFAKLEEIEFGVAQEPRKSAWLSEYLFH